MVTGAGALFQPLIGLLLDMAWKGQTLQGARIYDAGDYRVALTSVLAFSAVGFVTLLMVRETFCRPYAP